MPLAAQNLNLPIERVNRELVTLVIAFFTTDVLHSQGRWESCSHRLNNDHAQVIGDMLDVETLKSIAEKLDSTVASALKSFATDLHSGRSS